MGGEAKWIVTGRMEARGEGLRLHEEEKGRTRTAMTVGNRGIVLFPGQSHSEQIVQLSTVTPSTTFNSASSAQ